MNLTDLIGGIAATLTTVSFVPQAVRIIRTRHTQDISLPMYALFSVGILLWLIYGILIGDAPIVAANIVTLALSLTILTLKLRWG